ncbi:MAG: cobalamin-dependent protein [Fibrobacteres bacterium]|nr:cobalamin-dependent protein [Fibrobacterota bacterium]
MKPIRIVTATTLFDGHDVSINIFRRLFQRKGCEVVHLGHSRSVDEVVSAAVEEDADAVLVSSYQGGHNEYYRYLVDKLAESSKVRIPVFGGGGGVILPSEIEALHAYGVERIYHAEEGQRLGLEGIVDNVIERIKKLRSQISADISSIPHLITHLENTEINPDLENRLKAAAADKKSVVLGITGTGGSGKSSLTDELVSRLLKVSNDVRIAILAVDPSKSLTGGALLGDRIRMNSIDSNRVFFRSFATRGSGHELSHAIKDSVLACKAEGFSIVIVETSGIGQSNHAVLDVADVSVYVMTAEYGAPTQLEKIDMLELADFTALNKCRRPESEDAFRQVLLNYVRLKGIKFSHQKPGSLLRLKVPVYATEANEFNHPGVNALFRDLLDAFINRGAQFTIDEKILGTYSIEGHRDFIKQTGPSGYYLAEIADTLKKYHTKVENEAQKAETCQALRKTIEVFAKKGDEILEALRKELQTFENELSDETCSLLKEWPAIKERYSAADITYKVREKLISVSTKSASLAGLSIPRVALPRYSSDGDLVRFLYSENLPGHFPYTAGVFPFKSTAEDPQRQFAGEGSPEKTNRRLHYLSKDKPAKRLSIAFDPLTLYGESPDKRPDIFGKIGESGVSIATIDDMRRLFKGFDLLHPKTSVSMTINGPAPVILAMYFMTAVAEYEEKEGRILSDEERMELFRSLRGTVQADILKEDQSQNTCIFSIDFALRMMGDVQKYFANNRIRNYYTISISGYHIAEAGANPVTQLAFTLANGFHYVEHFLSLGLNIDDFAHNLSFFFSNGLDAEYSVLGRVARRIWAVSMRDKYGANERSQKLKYHIQTSGRSLHAQEIELNDVRTTLQALLAYYDNCNSLHTNAYDEAVTTPTEESVRRAMAIQLIVAKEFGMTANENPNQGSFIIEELTGLVEEAVLAEFRNIARRGGVLGAMEKQYQRGRIQEESLYYEEQKENGTVSIVGVNTFINENSRFDYDRMEVRRADIEEKELQIKRLMEFERRHAGESEPALQKLKEAALTGGNIFEALLTAVKVASIGKISKVLFELGGKYRRNV